ncbi:hypothetical protein [Deinococcus misasensis]|uniref:hypothetical protein n=1 Tax=Deinococcus misasensis TaxID=392413 RepID=UPI000552FF0A|nr:hypothetical protein [Deinococcus misasensis]
MSTATRSKFQLHLLDFSDPEALKAQLKEQAHALQVARNQAFYAARDNIPEEYKPLLLNLMDTMQDLHCHNAAAYVLKKLVARANKNLSEENATLWRRVAEMEKELQELRLKRPAPAQKAAPSKAPTPPAPPEHLLLEVARLRDQARNLQKQVDVLKQEKLTREEFVKDQNVKDLVQRVHELGGFNGQKAKRGPVSTTSTRSILVPTNETSVHAKARAIEERLKRVGGTATKSDLTASLGTSYFSEALKHLRLSNRVRVNGNQVRLT